jgi:hypothetical protein
MSLANLIKKGSLRGAATATVATVATHEKIFGPTVARVAGVAVAKASDTAAIDKAPDPDRWCYPYSTAMNTAEIDTFTVRLARFTDWGVILEDAERIADRLVIRDREQDERVVCVECKYLQGLNCRNWIKAGIAIKAEGAILPSSFTVLLQRCDGFKPAINFAKL